MHAKPLQGISINVNSALFHSHRTYSVTQGITAFCASCSPIHILAKFESNALFVVNHIVGKSFNKCDTQLRLETPSY